MKNNKKKIFIEALEQRIMLDGAGASTALDVIDERSKDKLLNKNTQKISKFSGIFKASSEGNLRMDDEILNIMNNLREFMFEKVYLRDETKKERAEAKKVVEKLVSNFTNNPNLLPEQYRTAQSELENAVDYVAGMTDRFALKEFSKL